MDKLLHEYRLGDMCAQYYVNEQTQRVGLELIPEGWQRRRRKKQAERESLAQVMIRGDDFPFGFANGHTMRNGASTLGFRYEEQIAYTEGGDTIVDTFLVNDKKCRIRHRLTHVGGESGVKVEVVFYNKGTRPVVLDMLASFSLGGLTPFLPGDAPNSMVLHRLRSKWSNEARLHSTAIEELQLEPTWSGHGAHSEKFGQVGSMPVRRFVPFAAVEDVPNGVCWGVQLACASSWQLEVYRKDDGLCLSGGLADYDFGHWSKQVEPGGSFGAPPAFLSVCAGNLDVLCNRLVSLQRRALQALKMPAKLPVVFNEFCTTWGEPSQRKVKEMLKVLQGRDIDYFVIDAGWYADEEKGWELNMGDWQVNRRLFPDGLEGAAQAIRAAGMRPGIWFEPEVCGKSAGMFERREHLLCRFGEPVTAGGRRFWDMRDPWVREYLGEKVIGLLERCGFDYIKIDYNESIGVGCDGDESLGEGLRRNMEGTKAFFEEIHARLPHVVVENCSSGGHRLEPSFLALSQLASFSDAHEQREIPVIAANLHRIMLPAQSLIWAVLRKEDSERRLVWSLSAACLGVMCLSGDIHELGAEQWETVERAIAFYREASPVIESGVTVRHGPPVASYRHPAGWQAVERTSGDGTQKLVIAHVFDDASGQIELDVGPDYAVRAQFCERGCEPKLADATLHAKLGGNGAFAVLLERRKGGDNL